MTAISGYGLVHCEILVVRCEILGDSGHSYMDCRRSSWISIQMQF